MAEKVTIIKLINSIYSLSNDKPTRVINVTLYLHGVVILIACHCMEKLKCTRFLPDHALDTCHSL